MQHPSPHQLRVFEACGRHGSFARAAAELNVTASAVSHQIKLMEEMLGRPLFLRTNRRVALAEDAQEYWSIVHNTFVTLRTETERIFNVSERPLRVLCARSFLRNWVLPRLSGFYQRYQDAKIEFVTYDKSENISPFSADVAIRLGDGHWRGCSADRLAGITLFPIGSPRYLAAHPKITAPDDLRHHVLIRSVGRPGDWAAWFTAAGVADIDMTRGIGLEGETLEYQAAVAGLGIALGREGYCEEDLKEGRLVRLFTISARAEGEYYLIIPHAHRHDTRAMRFREWLLAAAKA